MQIAGRSFQALKLFVESDLKLMKTFVCPVWYVNFWINCAIICIVATLVVKMEIFDKDTIYVCLSFYSICILYIVQNFLAQIKVLPCTNFMPASTRSSHIYQRQTYYSYKLIWLTTYSQVNIFSKYTMCIIQLSKSNIYFTFCSGEV